MYGDSCPDISCLVPDFARAILSRERERVFWVEFPSGQRDKLDSGFGIS